MKEILVEWMPAILVAITICVVGSFILIDEMYSENLNYMVVEHQLGILESLPEEDQAQVFAYRECISSSSDSLQRNICLQHIYSNSDTKMMSYSEGL